MTSFRCRPQSRRSCRICDESLKRVESPGSYIQSAARATFSAYRSVPVRWRLAGGSAALTFVILAAFAAGVGVVTNNELRGQFNDQVHSAADQLRDEIQPLTWGTTGLGPSCR